MGNVCDTEAVREVLETEEVEKSPSPVPEAAVSKILCGPVEEMVFPRDLSVGQRFYNSLRRLPSTFQLMIESDSKREITAQETLEKAVGLATSFTDLGLKKFNRVLIVAENGIDVTITAIATLLAGMVFCPVDALLKSYEYQHLLKIIDPKIIVCELSVIPELQDAMQKIGLEVPIYAVNADETDNIASLNDLFKNVPWQDFTAVPCDDQRTEPALILCSSGTTGLPKGVELSQYSALCSSGPNELMWPPGTVFLHTSYFYWISGVLAMFASIVNGMKRVLLKTNDPLDAMEAIDKYKPNRMVLSPAMLNGIVFHNDLQKYDLSSMKVILAGGSPILKTTLDQCKEVLPHSYVVQGFGATELGGVVSMTPPGVDQLSLGLVSTNCKVKIVDKDTGELLGPNEEGELQCQSASIMTCYVGNESATREVIDEEGWYHTGDIGKYNEDSVLYITGRMKELIKVDNHQIAPIEIEGVIAQVEGVDEAVVVAVTADGKTLLMALVVTDEGVTVKEQDIIEAVEEKLSEFKKLKGGVYFVDAIPRTHTGKLKRILCQKLGQDLYNGSHAE